MTVGKDNKENLLKMNLQLFAEDPAAAEEGDAGGAEAQADKGDAGNDGVSIEEIMAENARLKVENTRNKVALDKALKNAGELTKQLRAKMTAAEQEEEAKKEAEEAQRAELNELKEFKRRTEARDRYLSMGMSVEFAKQAADAEVKGDMDAFATVMKQYNDASLKEREAEWLKSRPDINVGHGDEADEMTKLSKEIDAAMGL